jgi:hypothetical protein
MLADSSTKALLLSIVIEASLAAIVGRYWRETPRQLAIVASGATLLTHPFVWPLFARLEGRLSYGASLVLIESIVVIVEAIAFHWAMNYSISRSMRLSLLFNGASLFLGSLIFNRLWYE